MNDLYGAAQYTGLLRCSGSLTLTDEQMAAARWGDAPDLALTAEQLACAAAAASASPTGCCLSNASIRPNTTDATVFRAVFKEHGFFYLWVLHFAA